MTKNQPVQQDMVQNDMATINLMELFFRLLDAWKLLLIFTVLFAAAGWGYARYLVVPQYKATATIYVLSNKDSVLNVADLQIGSALTTDYVSVFKVWEVQQQVIDNLGLQDKYSITDMREHLTISHPSNTRMLDISFTSSDPQEAVRVANEYAEVGSQYISEKMAVDHPSVMSEARYYVRTSTSPLRMAVLVGFLGLLLSAIFVVVRFLLDDKVRTADDVLKYTGLINLAAIPAEDVQKGGAARE